VRLGEIELEIGDELYIWMCAMDGKPDRRHPYTAKIIGFDECKGSYPIVVVVGDSSWGELVYGDYVINGIRRRIRGP